MVLMHIYFSVVAVKSLTPRFQTFGFFGNTQVMKFNDLKELGSEPAVKVCTLNETLFVCLANLRGSGVVNEYSMLQYFPLVTAWSWN